MVKYDKSTGLVASVQASEYMGDARHKKSPPTDLTEDPLTDDFIQATLKALKDNKALNEAEGVVEGQTGYRIDSRAALARALSKLLKTRIGDTQIVNLIGPKRPGSKWRKRPATSRYVRPVIWLLKLDMVLTKTIVVPERHAAFFETLAKLDDKFLLEFAAIVQKRTQGDLPK